jgi:hypothetical protein
MLGDATQLLDAAAGGKSPTTAPRAEHHRVSSGVNLCRHEISAARLRYP